MLRLLYQLDVILHYNLKILGVIMFDDYEGKCVANLDYKLDKKELALMITKVLFIRCYTNKCYLSLDILQHNIMHYIIALTPIHFPKVTLHEQTNIVVLS